MLCLSSPSSYWSSGLFRGEECCSDVDQRLRKARCVNREVSGRSVGDFTHVAMLLKREVS
jgi:hypothetical protein